MSASRVDHGDRAGPHPCLSLSGSCPINIFMGLVAVATVVGLHVVLPEWPIGAGGQTLSKLGMALERC